jgi:hypothetical protein
MSAVALLLKHIAPRGLLAALVVGLAAFVAAVMDGEARRSFYQLELQLAAPTAIDVQVFWDQGRGFSETNSVHRTLTAAPELVPQRFPLGTGRIQHLRLDPTRRDTAVRYGGGRIITSMGRVLAELPPGNIRPGNDIADLEAESRQVTIIPTRGAHDPWVHVPLEQPLELRYGLREWVAAGGAAFVIAFVVAVVLGAIRLGGSRRVILGHLQHLADAWPRTTLGLGAILFWLAAAVSWPGPAAMGLDASWHQALSYFREQGLQFGRDIAFPAGPWGHLFVYHLLEQHLVGRLWFEFLGKAALSLMLLVALGHLPLWRRAVIIFLLIGSAALILDAWIMFLVSLIVLNVLLRPDVSRTLLGAGLVTITFLGLVKFSFLVMAGAGTAVAVGAALWRDDRRRAAWIAAGFVASFLFWWMAAGQNPIRIPRYLRLSLELSAGYGWAMALTPSRSVFGVALAALAPIGWFLWHHLRTTAARAIIWPMAATTAGLVFVVWKAGFTRADGHVMIFFFYLAALALALPPLFGYRRAFHFLDLVPLACLIGVWCFDDRMTGYASRGAWYRVQNSISQWMQPGQAVAQWKQTAEAERRRARLPHELRDRIGSASVDYINYEQSLLLLNEFNYRPRLVFQSYSAYTPELMERNLGWLQRSDRGAQFILYDHTTIDRRFPTQDDALLLADLPRRYRTVWHNEHLLLLERQAEQPAADLLPRKLHQRVGAAFGEEIPVPMMPELAQWLSLELRLTRLGQLRSLLFAPPSLRIIATDLEGRSFDHRLIPSIARQGFVIQPFLQNLSDVRAFMEGKVASQLRSFRIEPAPEHEEFWHPPIVQFHHLPTLPLQEQNWLEVLTASGITNLSADAYEAPFRPEILQEAGRTVVQVHSPGRLRFPWPTGASQLTATYGLRAAAYAPPSATDGVDFVVVASTVDGDQVELYRRPLRPLDRAGDRGPQVLAIQLPEDGNYNALELVTDPGPAGNADWDWSYWADIRLLPPEAGQK